ncbi:MAG: hypothetical protein FWD13_08410 [Treponema sp.]|nr:hypothetical protein [Treponema sp.]
MTKNQSHFIRFLLFLAGAGIIVLAFFLTKGDVVTDKDAFVWFSISVMYLVLFLPFLVSVISTKNFSSKIPAISLIWFGIPLYIIASVAVIILLAVVHILPLNIAIIIQSILFFIFLIIIYFSYFAVSRVKSVAAEEAVKQQYITQIKSKANVLLLSVNKLTGEYENTQKILKQSMDDIRYIYPVNAGAGDELELNILRSLGSLSQHLDSILSGAHNPMLDKEAVNLQSLVNERKLLRN